MKVRQTIRSPVLELSRGHLPGFLAGLEGKQHELISGQWEIISGQWERGARITRKLPEGSGMVLQIRDEGR